ncbi:MAG TPA: sigma-70 family RNA polymerase sigma factor [Candidatus Acidoferrum sp.]|jgi:RNA polymerase sigma-70 factor (ECF subfamily)
MTQHSFCSETELLRRARRGDQEAFGQLAGRYSGRILATSRRILRNSADAEDNVQNVLVKAYINLRQFHETALLSTWLTRITINEALMKLRASSAEKNRIESVQDPIVTAPMGPPTNRMNPEAQCIARELAYKAMKSVSPALRQAFVLYAVEGWTQKELSTTQGIALQTVKTRIFRARRKMKANLKAAA